MTSDGRSLDIVVIGGSLGGLFAAIPLLRMPEKHRVTILERNGRPLLHDQGAGIVAGGNVQKWVEKFDVFGREARVISKTRMYLSREGQVVDREDFTQWMTSWDLLYHLGRANFDGQKSAHVSEHWEKLAEGPEGEKLREAWGRAKYEYGRSVEDLEVVDEKVEVTWRDTRDGSQAKGQVAKMTVDFVVCADDPSSRTRGMLLGEVAQRKYAGYVAFRGTVPENELELATSEVHADSGYTIPGIEGTVEPGKRLVNWVWYWNFAEGTNEYEEVLGDALAGFRPHTAASTSQAAFDALNLEMAFAGKTTWNEYEDKVLGYATSWQHKGVMLGTSSQFEKVNGAKPLRMMARD